MPTHKIAPDSGNKCLYSTADRRKIPSLLRYFWYSGDLSLLRRMKGFVKVTDMQQVCLSKDYRVRSDIFGRSYFTR